MDKYPVLKRLSCLLSLLAFFLCLPVFSQEALPFTENFTKSAYQGDNQNWNVVQGSDNAMYFANNHYLLRYNGNIWEKYTLPNKTIIRSLFVVGDRIYCGSYREFGYWQRKEGIMHYHSVSQGKNLFTGRSENEEIWKVFGYGKQIFFQSFNELFTLSENGSITKKHFPYQISYCYLIDGEIFFATVRHGVYILKNGVFTRKENWDAVSNSIIHGIAKYGKRIYIFTKTDGVFVDDNGILSKWESPLNGLLKEQVVLTATFFGDKLAIGTGLQGLYIVDLKTGNYQNVNRENAIRNNAVLSIGIDKENDIWLGLDNGIAHVEVNSSVRIFSDNTGILGSVYALSPFRDGFIFVTNHGVFTYKDKKLRPIEGSQGQVWDIYKNGSEYIIGHNDGTYIFDGTTYKRANTVNGGWKFFRSDFDHVYFQANYSGIAYYKSIDDLGKWGILNGFAKPIRNIVQNKPHELWAADSYRGLYRIRYDDQFNTIGIDNISQQNGIKNDFSVRIFSYKNELLFLIDKNWYTYNSISGKLSPDAVFNRSFRNIADVIPVDDESFVVLREGLLYVVRQTGNRFIWDLIPEKYYEGKVIAEDTKALKMGNKIVLNLDDGFISYDLNALKKVRQKLIIEGFYNGSLITDKTSIKYNQAVEINVIPEYYGFNRPDLFYRLNENGAYIRIKGGRTILNNLGSGRQDLKFYTSNGSQFVEVSNYSFKVDRPWYFSLWMILLYILFTSGVFFLYYRWNKLRYIQKLQLKEEEMRHQKKILEIELKAENELYLQEYEKHILELEVQAKSSEVAGKSLSIAKQSEMIEHIQKILEEEKEIGKLKSEIKKAIKINSVNKHEWEKFESSLAQVHNTFIVDLSKKYPVLTSKDIKLCVYLKMNLSSKEIAPLMNISFRGVELHRYRLRKKLGLSQEESLSKFMLTV